MIQPYQTHWFETPAAKVLLVVLILILGCSYVLRVYFSSLEEPEFSPQQTKATEPGIGGFPEPITSSDSRILNFSALKSAFGGKRSPQNLLTECHRPGDQGLDFRNWLFGGAAPKPKLRRQNSLDTVVILL